MLSRPTQPLLRGKSLPEVPRCYQDRNGPCSRASRGQRCLVVIRTHNRPVPGEVAAAGVTLLSRPTWALLRGKSRPEVPRCYQDPQSPSSGGSHGQSYHDSRGPCSGASRGQRCLVVITTHTALAPSEVTARVITTHTGLAPREVTARGATLLLQLSILFCATLVNQQKPRGNHH